MDKGMSWRSAAIALLGLTTVMLVLPACTSKTLRSGQDALRQGNLKSAEQKLEAYAKENKDTKNTVIAYLEAGHIRRLREKYPPSNEAFAHAEDRIEAMDRQAEFRVSKEGAAALTNLNALPYRARNYDRIMMSTYRALNYLQMQDIEAARVELQKVYEWQKLAVQRNAERIEEVKQAAESAKEKQEEKGEESYDVDRARNDEKFQKSLDEKYGDLDQFEPYSKYVNPFSEWLRGIYYLSLPADQGDIGTGKTAIERAYGMEGDNPYLRQDLQLAENRKGGAKFPPLTYVVFCTGDAPDRGQIRIDIPLFLVNNEVDYVGVNFPRLIENETYVNHLNVHGGGETYKTATLADMDSIVAHEFKQNLPVIITKTLIGAGTKAASAYGLNKATEGNAVANVVTRVATTAYQVGMNQADLRAWTTLPKQIQYARLKTPESGQLTLTTPSGPSTTVSVQPGEVNVVTVKSYAPGKPLDVNKFLLERNADVPSQPADNTAAASAASDR